MRRAGASLQKKRENPPPSHFLSATQLFMRVLDGCHRVLLRGPTLCMRCISVGLGFFMVTLIVLIDCLKMVIGRGDVMGCGKMMVLARRVALGVMHDGFLPIGGGKK